jgi:SAM-dependent methyltransferase
MRRVGRGFHPYLEEAALSHFNEQANEWDTESKVALMGLLAKKSLDVLALDKPIDIMDFGCGTGLFGLEFAGYAKTLVGIDTSPGMLDVFNRKIGGHRQFRSLQIDLETEDLRETFDLVVSSMAFHHLNDPRSMILKFKSMLNKGGRLAIVDLYKEDGSFHSDPQQMGVKHFGFSQEEHQEWADRAHMQVRSQLINNLQKGGKSYDQFLAVFS